MDVLERARRYVARLPGSVSGQGGHDAAFRAACALVHGFALDEAAALGVMRETFNPMCSPPWSERELEHKVRSAAGVGSERPPGYLLGEEPRGPAPQTRVAAPAPEKRVQSFAPERLAEVQHRALRVDRDWLRARSPVDPAAVPGAAGFLSGVFEKGEKALVFCAQWSQGDFGVVSSGDWRVPGQVWALGRRPGLQATRARGLPAGGQDGIWWLCQPVSGEWRPNGSSDKQGRPVVSRRSRGTVTRWPHLVLESDEAPEEQWLNVLAQLPLPLVAIYTSGRRSVHGLVRLGVESKAGWDATAQVLAPVLSRLGADARAMTAVRLTRLPFCRRGKAMQELVYFDPDALAAPIAAQAVRR